MQPEHHHASDDIERERLLEAAKPPEPYDLALTPDGVVIVGLEDIFDSHIINRHWREVVLYRLTGIGDPLREFEGIGVGGRQLLSDPDVVDDWFARRGRFA